MIKALKHKLYNRTARTFRALLQYGRPYQSFLYNGKYTEGELDTVRMYYSLGLATLIQGKSWLDLGCNEGSICLLAAQDGARPVTGVDIQESYLSNARKYAQAAGLKADFINKDIVAFVKEATPYDVISLFAMARHVYNQLMRAHGYPIPKTGRAILIYNSFETLILGMNNPIRDQFDGFLRQCIEKANEYFILSINDHSGQILRKQEQTKQYIRNLSGRIREIEIYSFSPQNPEYVVIKTSLSQRGALSQRRN